jgi:hypothetical protein
MPVLGLLAGCSTSTYTVQVDAIAQPATAAAGPPPQTYHVRSKNPRLDETTLRYKEVSDYVKTALSSKGMYEAPKPELADVVIDIDYGMDTPRVKFETISQLVEVQTESTRRPVEIPVITKDANGNIKVEYHRGEELIPGRREIVGTREEVIPVVVYEKYLKISARQNREAEEGRPAPELWSVNVSAEDKSQELRKYIPILASATADYIGTNTKEEKAVKIDEKDDAVKFIKKGM